MTWAGSMRSMLDPGAEHYKFIDLPLSNYASASYDKVVRGSKTVGISMFSGYSYNERSMLSLGIVDPDIEIGDELVLVWGEEGGGTKKTTVERHKQIEIRVVVSPGAVLRRRAQDLRRRLAHHRRAVVRVVEHVAPVVADRPIFFWMNRRVRPAFDSSSFGGPP